MNYHMVESLPWPIYAYGVRLVIHTTQPTNILGPRATKMVFVGYIEHSRGYVMYGEHPNGGMIKLDSCIVDFLEDEFQAFVKAKWT